MREPVTIADLSEAVAGSVGALRGGVDRDWSVPAGPPDARAWHPYGTADGEGWAAVSIVETVVHTADVAAGLGLPYTPDEAVCARVVDRLFPGAPPDPSEWARLRWATGRLDLPGHPRPESWRWHSAPLT